MSMSSQVRVREVKGRRLEVQDFDVLEQDLPDIAPGEVRVENLFMSVDPYMKECLEPGSRLVPDSVKFFPGRPLPAHAVGRVVGSRDDAFAPGDVVTSFLGWRDRFNARPEDLLKVQPEGLPLETFLGPLGQTGLTAFVGLRFAAVKPGDVVFVSAAAGAVGSVVCQLAKMRGARVIGSAGGAAKTGFLREIGVDDVIDYKETPDLAAALRKAAPDGIDVYYDNVGGQHLVAAVDIARPHARVIICGNIANESHPGVPNLSLAIPNNISFQGFSVRYNLHEMLDFHREMTPWLKSGLIRWRATVEEGLAAAPGALFRQLRGDNVGKMLVKLA